MTRKNASISMLNDKIFRPNDNNPAIRRNQKCLLTGSVTSLIPQSSASVHKDKVNSTLEHSQFLLFFKVKFFLLLSFTCITRKQQIIWIWIPCPIGNPRQIYRLELAASLSF